MNSKLLYLKVIYKVHFFFLMSSKNQTSEIQGTSQSMWTLDIPMTTHTEMSTLNHLPACLQKR